MKNLLLISNHNIQTLLIYNQIINSKECHLRDIIYHNNTQFLLQNRSWSLSTITTVSLWLASYTHAGFWRARLRNASLFPPYRALKGADPGAGEVFEAGGGADQHQHRCAHDLLPSLRVRLSWLNNAQSVGRGQISRLSQRKPDVSVRGRLPTR